MIDIEEAIEMSIKYEEYEKIFKYKLLKQKILEDSNVSFLFIQEKSALIKLNNLKFINKYFPINNEILNTLQDCHRDEFKRFKKMYNNYKFLDYNIKIKKT